MKNDYDTPIVPVRAMKGIKVNDIYFIPEILLTLLPGESLGEYRNRIIQATLEGRITKIENVKV